MREVFVGVQREVEPDVRGDLFRLEGHRSDGVGVVHIEFALGGLPERDLVDVDVVGSVLVGVVERSADVCKSARRPRADHIVRFVVIRLGVGIEFHYLMIMRASDVAVVGRLSVGVQVGLVKLEAPVFVFVDDVIHAFENRLVGFAVGGMIVVVIFKGEVCALHDLAVDAVSDRHEFVAVRIVGAVAVGPVFVDGRIDRVPFGVLVEQLDGLRDDVVVLVMERLVCRASSNGVAIPPIVAVIGRIVFDAVHKVDVLDGVCLRDAYHLTAKRIVPMVGVVIVSRRTADTAGIARVVLDIAVPIADDAVDVTEVVLRMTDLDDGVEHGIDRVHSDDDARNAHHIGRVPNVVAALKRRQSLDVAFAVEDDVVDLSAVEHPADEAAAVRSDARVHTDPSV